MFSSMQQWWEIGKKQIQQLCKQYHFNVSRSIAKKIEVIENDIIEIQGLIEVTGKNVYKKNVLENLLAYKAQGALIRSRFQDYSEMDAPSKFLLFVLEKKNGQSRFIHCLKDANGQELSEASDIHQRIVEFFEELYKSECRR